MEMRADQDRVLGQGFPGEARPEPPGILAPQTGPTLRGMLEPKDAALERVDVLEADGRCERDLGSWLRDTSSWGWYIHSVV